MNPHFSKRLDGLEGSALRELIKLTSQPGVISFAGGMPAPELFDAPGIMAASQAALEQHSAVSLQYGTTEGMPALRDRIAALVQAKGIQASADDIIITSGSSQGISLIGQVLLDPGDRVVMERPTYPAGITMARLRQSEILTVGVDADGLDLDELEQHLRSGVRLLYLVPTYGNPSGATLSLERRVRLLELVAAHDSMVIEDDPYSALHFDQPGPPPLAALAAQVPGAADRVMYLSSFSKTIAPGLRLGFMVASRAVLERAVIVKQEADGHTSMLTQHIALAYLDAGRMPAHLERIRASYHERAKTAEQAFRAQLPGLRFHAPAGGMFIWGRLPGWNTRTVLESAVAAGVVFVPGANFYADRPDAETMRLSFATADLNTIREGAERLGRVVRAMGSA